MKIATILGARPQFIKAAPHDSKQLIGSPLYRRVDIGEYRIIYRVEKDTVKIAVVGKRNDDLKYQP